MAHSVLVVEDDAGIREVAAQVLQEEGFAVDTASNGWQALDRITAHQPDVVLLDLQLPMLSGWGVLQQLRAHAIAVPVVIMTAGYRAAEEAARQHVDGFVAKPFHLQDLVAEVERVAAGAAA
jgi:DNA-binding response OmpR family regulator